MDEVELGTPSVGPVLEATQRGRALARAIAGSNPGARVQDRGGYLRVLVPARCSVTRTEIERALGAPFLLPQDLEALMPAFKGVLSIEGDEVQWSSQR